VGAVVGVGSSAGPLIHTHHARTHHRHSSGRRHRFSPTPQQENAAGTSHIEALSAMEWEPPTRRQACVEATVGGNQRRQDSLSDTDWQVREDSTPSSPEPRAQTEGAGPGVRAKRRPPRIKTRAHGSTPCFSKLLIRRPLSGERTLLRCAVGEPRREA